MLPQITEAGAGNDNSQNSLLKGSRLDYFSDHRHEGTNRKVNRGQTIISAPLAVVGRCVDFGKWEALRCPPGVLPSNYLPLCFLWLSSVVIL